MRPGPRGGDVGVAAKSLWTGAARARQGIRPAAAHRRLRRVATSEELAALEFLGHGGRYGDCFATWPARPPQRAA